MKQEEEEDIKDCLLRVESRSFSIDEMQLSFDQIGSMVFSVDLGLGSSCVPVNEMRVEIPTKQVQKYIKE